jgi:hypothetical protein
MLFSGFENQSLKSAWDANSAGIRKCIRLHNSIKSFCNGVPEDNMKTVICDNMKTITCDNNVDENVHDNIHDNIHDNGTDTRIQHKTLACEPTVVHVL